MNEGPLTIETVESMPFGENSYVAYPSAGGDCIVFDPGMEPDLIAELLDERRLTPTALLITHGHGDHIAGIPAMKARWPKARVIIGRDEASKLIDPMANLSMQFGMPITCDPADELCDEGGRVTAAGLEFDVAKIPGHSSGHVVFIWHGGPRPVVFAGDVLFAGSIGRTDFPDGDFATLAEGIRTKLYTLPDDTLVLPGHGPPTTVGREKRTNPFVPGHG